MEEQTGLSRYLPTRVPRGLGAEVETGTGFFPSIFEALKKAINPFPETNEEGLSVTEILSQLPDRIATSIESAIQRLINIILNGGIQSPTSFNLDDLKGLNALTDVGLNKPQSANLDLNFSATDNIQLIIDGRLLAAIVKQYIFEDLIRFEGTGGSATRVSVV